MSRALLVSVVAAAALLAAGAAWAQCCGGPLPPAQAPQATADTGATQIAQKACPPDCTKPCCVAKATVAKTCPPECAKPCCVAKATAARGSTEYKSAVVQQAPRTWQQRTIRQCVALRRGQAAGASVHFWPYWDSYRPHPAW